MILWIARDEDGTISLYYDSPIKEIGSYYRGIYYKGYFYSEYPSMYLTDEDFPEITWENSPQQLELKLCNAEFEQIEKKFLDSIETMPPEIDKIVGENFWDLL